MPTGVDVPQRIIPHIRIPVQVLRVAGVRHNRVRADEPTQCGIVEARLVVVQAEGLLPALAGEAVFDWEGTVASPLLQCDNRANQRSGIALA